MADLFELASFLLMLYTAGIAFYITKRATRVGLPYLCLSLLLSLMILFHGIHHLFTFLQYPFMQDLFEFCASALALILALDYAYVWRRQ
ncbi:MAG: hypothetical protein ABSD49_02920 [Candidatus Bathyarchaeia archaeon]